MSATEIHDAKLEAFTGKAVLDLGAIISAPLFMLGEKAGLYRAMAHAGQVLAERAGVAERSARDWLRKRAAGGYVGYDPGSDRYAGASAV